MNFEQIEELVVSWGIDRSIFEQSCPRDQLKKLAEELVELCEGVHEYDRNKICDAIGDMLVVLTMVAKFNNLDLKTCYSIAYNEIKDRKGKMVNGLVVKETI